MPRGGHKVKPAKPAQNDCPAQPDVLKALPAITKLKRTNADWKGSLLGLSRSSTAKSSESVPDSPSSAPQLSALCSSKLDASISSSSHSRVPNIDQAQPVTQNNSFADQRLPTRPIAETTIVETQKEDQDTDQYKSDLEIFAGPRREATWSSASSSLYSKNSVSSHGFDDDDSTEPSERDSDLSLDTRLASGPQNRIRPPLTRQETIDTTARERSALAKKAALFKNSRLSPELPSFHTNLPTWAMICRAAKASQDCYDSHAVERRGTYIPADTSKDMKAMTVDDQLIDESRMVVIAIRGTQSQSLADWSINTNGNPTKPVDFLDDAENACHSGFLQVTKAMVARVATQLRQHPAVPERPILLFTGHSAGAAIAVLLYSHMLSTSISSDLTALVPLFSSINCITFGAPPISQTPLTKRDHAPGIFLALANEGDLVLRTSNAAYFKSLAKLMTASPPASTAAAIAPPAVKVVRGSRGAAVYRQPVAVAPPMPWEELPLWPTPAPSLTNAGNIVLLRDRESGGATASSITAEDLREVIFGDLAQHTIEMYLRRVKELALNAMLGREL